MGKILGICLAVLCVVMLAACVNDGSGVSASAALSASDAASGAPSGTESPGTAPPSAESLQQPSGPVIAESSNTVSDKEKQAILSQLSEELDSALNVLDSLEDLDDSDLDADVID